MAEGDTAGASMKELYIYIIGIVLGLVAYFGSVNGVLERLGVDHDHVHESAFFILITTVLITSRLAQAAREVNVYADIEARLLAWQKSVPILNDVVYFNHSDEALHYLIRRIPEAKQIRNTRVVLERSIGEKPLYQRYVAAIRRGLANRLIFCDLVSEEFRVDADKLVEYCQNRAGRYTYEVCPASVITINFAILDYGNGHQEVLFGWGNTRTERPIFKVSDKRVVDYFVQIHDAAVHSLKRKMSNRAQEGGPIA